MDNIKGKAKLPAKLNKVYKTLFNHFGSQNWWPGDTKIEICVGAILTQNTSWGNVEKAILNLKRERKLSVKALSSISEDILADLIRPSGFFNVKAKRLKNFIDFVNEKFDGSLQKMFKCSSNGLRDSLLLVNGVGNETCDSILLYAGSLPCFVIDAYTKRAFSRMTVCSSDISYENLQKIFIENLPLDFKLYNEYHALIVMLGKHFCKPKPLCSECPLYKNECFFKV